MILMSLLVRKRRKNRSLVRKLLRKSIKRSWRKNRWKRTWKCMQGSSNKCKLPGLRRRLKERNYDWWNYILVRVNSKFWNWWKIMFNIKIRSQHHLLHTPSKIHILISYKSLWWYHLCDRVHKLRRELDYLKKELLTRRM
jgi:hypothetical protein